MDRRGFLKSSGALVAGLSMPTDPAAARALLPTGASKNMQANPLAGRLILSLNRDWRFSAQPPAGATARDFEDSAWVLVTVPHANRRLPWHGFDEKSYQFV